MKILTIGLALFGLWMLLRRAFSAPPPRRETRRDAPPPPKAERPPEVSAQDLEACPNCGAFKDPAEDCRACGEKAKPRQAPSGRA